MTTKCHILDIDIIMQTCLKTRKKYFKKSPHNSYFKDVLLK